MKEILCAIIIRLRCKSLPYAIRISLCKRTRIHAYGSVPYISLNFDFVVSAHTFAYVHMNS